MRKWMGIWRRMLGLFVISGIAFVSAAVVCACTSRVDDDYKLLVDRFSEVFLPQDADSTAYDEVLEQIRRYLDDRTLGNLMDARDAVDGQIEAFTSLSKAYESPVIDEEFARVLRKFEIEPEEFRIQADTRVGELLSYVDSLNIFKIFLDDSDADRETFRFIFNQSVDVQEYSRRFNFYGINYYFAPLKGEQLEYARDVVVSRLSSFYFEDMAWETDRDVIEAKGNAFLTRLEEERDRISAEIGREQKMLDGVW